MVELEAVSSGRVALDSGDDTIFEAAMKYEQFLELNDCASVEAFEAGIAGFAARTGFERYSACVMYRRADGAGGIRTLHNAPAPFSEIVTRNGLDAERDPLLTHTRRSSLPMAYDQAVYVDAGTGDLWEEQAPFGYRAGIAVGVHRPGGSFLIGFDGPDALPASDRSLVELFATLQLIAVHAQPAAARLLVPSVAGVDLTARQREVLRLLAAGLQNKAIANRLGITVSGVDKHLAALCGKLGAPNRYGLIARALELGLG